MGGPRLGFKEKKEKRIGILSCWGYLPGGETHAGLVNFWPTQFARHVAGVKRLGVGAWVLLKTGNHALHLFQHPSALLGCLRGRAKLRVK